METTSIETRAAAIMGNIMAGIDAAAERQRAYLEQQASRRAEIEADEKRRLHKAQFYFTPILQRAAKGCHNILTLVSQSESLQAIINHIEKSSGKFGTGTKIFSQFHLFITDALGRNESGDDDMHLYITLGADGQIEIYIERFDPSEPATIGQESHFNALRNIFFPEWKSYPSMERMVQQYQHIKSPLSWNIPMGRYREDWVNFQLVALRVLAQCANQKMLEKYMTKALSRIVH